MSQGKAIMELVGTAVLVLTIQLAVSSGSDLAPAAIGLGLMVIVYAGAPISGAHYNPAVSLAIMLRGKMDVPAMIIYWIAQLLGGWLGAVVGGTIAGGSYNVVSAGAGVTATQAFEAEIVFTFILCFVVLGVATNSAAANNSYFGAAIGLTVTAGAISVGGISGGAFNPAVALGLAAGAGGTSLMYALVTSGANLIGGLLAAIIFRLTALSEFESSGGGGTAGERQPLV